MTFGNFKVKQEAGGNRITDRQAATTFMLSLDKSYQTAAHWRRVAEALEEAFKTPDDDGAAGEAFKAALDVEGWLE